MLLESGGLLLSEGEGRVLQESVYWAVWLPKSDITPYEAALLIPLVVARNAIFPTGDLTPALATLGAGALRHFLRF